jgi:DNA mismatch repair ATPase MutS
MVLFIALAGDLFWYFRGFDPLFLMGGILLLAGFGLLLRSSFLNRDRVRLFRKLIFVNTNEIHILEGKPNLLKDGGNLMTKKEWLEDLDIFGPHSLFHFLNRTTTSAGSLRLACWLTHPPPLPDWILQNQQAVQTLAAQREVSQNLQAHGLLAEKKEGGDSLSPWFQTQAHLTKLPWLMAARWLLPLFSLGALLNWRINGNFWPLLLGICVNWSLIRSFRSSISQQHAMIGNKQSVLDQYLSILKTVQNLDPGESVRWKELIRIAAGAIQEINRLTKLANAFDQRLNMLVNLLLNSLLIYDIHCIAALEKWKEKNREHWSGWIASVGEIEALNSLSVFSFNHPGSCYPEPSGTVLGIEAGQLAHPLIPEKERIANDFSIGKEAGIHLVTGSNMSGKTTFLRTVAVNLILAQSGATVIASFFRFQPLQILSSLRTRDSLHEHHSYFLAELRKLQQIILQLESGGPAIVLIDEILKGTNSEDKTNGSGQFIRRLLHYRCLGLFATHDLALSRMEDEFPGKIRNYCFESQIREGELFFDYTLQKGVAKNKNASFLMRKMGIIE